MTVPFEHVLQNQFENIRSNIQFPDTNLNREIDYLQQLIFASQSSINPLTDVADWSIVQLLNMVCSLGLTLNSEAKQCMVQSIFAPEFACHIAKLYIGYRGEIAIATRFKVIKGATSTLVYEKDQFECSGANQEINHKVRSLSIDETVRGRCIGGYCRSDLYEGGVLNSFLSIEELDAIAQQQIEFNQGNTPWNSIWRAEMRRIALYRRASKDWRARINGNQAVMQSLVMTDSGVENV